jgi:glycosyltransferase involved in cell wall biosynthesis
MKFSILITNFNKGPYLDECINSCINQIHKDFEIILGDNNSDDESLKIIDKYKKKIIFFQQKKRSNISAVNQINILIEAFKYATGDYLCFLDSDDFYLSDKIEKLNSLLSRGEFDIIFDVPKILQNPGNLVSFKYKKKIRKNIWPVTIPTSSITISRSFFEEIIKHKFLDDYDLLEIDFRISVIAEIMKKKKLILNPGNNIYRNTEGSIMKNYSFFKKKMWEKRVMAHKYFFYINDYFGKKYFKTYDYFISKFISKIFI